MEIENECLVLCEDNTIRKVWIISMGVDYKYILEGDTIATRKQITKQKYVDMAMALEESLIYL